MTNRIAKVDKLIKEELGKIIQNDIEISKNTLITITRVKTLPNLSQSFVYISIMGPEEKEISEILKNKIYNIQQHLNKRLHMRPVPKIVFKLEKEIEKAARIEELLEKIKEK
jgi:ribosome-binding factor A